MAQQVIQDIDARELRRWRARLETETAPEIEQFLTDALTKRRMLERH